MTIIVTGGAGFIGSNFIFHMLNKYPDYRIICLDCLTYAGNLSTLEPVMSNPNFRFVRKASQTAKLFTNFSKKSIRIWL
jgi:dTDP-glucose 4,6-dehydratase